MTEKYLGGFQPDNKVQALCMLCLVGNATWHIHVHAAQLYSKGQWDCPGAQSDSRAEKLAQSLWSSHSKALLRFLWSTKQEYVIPSEQ